MTISEQNLMFWIKNNLNVLFKGKHGVGKTSMILDAFNKNNLKWQYFSAATMDPWVDFVGVPKERIDDKGKPYLDLVRPKHFQDDEVEAIFMDEFNRASKKVRNAVMELIQFKSINGKKFNNLKIIWAAVNPDDDKDEEYDVEKLDAAQLDRFHVHVDVPYMPSAPYFKAKHGEAIMSAALEWWHELSKDEKSQVSPRRLDYALEMYKLNGDLRFVIPKTVNVSKLLSQLKNGSYSDQLETAFKSKDVEVMKKFISDENCLAACIKQISKSEELMTAFLPLINKERLTSIIASNKNVTKFILDNAKSYVPLLEQLSKGGNAKLMKDARAALDKINPPKLNKSAINKKIVAQNIDLNLFEQDLTWSERMLTKYESSSADRLRIYSLLCANCVVPSNLIGNMHRRFLNILTTIAYRSQKNTVQTKMPFLIDMIRNVLIIYPNSSSVLSFSVKDKLSRDYGLKF